MSDNVVKFVPDLDKLTSRIVLNQHRDPQQLRAIMEGICADYGLGSCLKRSVARKRSTCKTSPSRWSSCRNFRTTSAPRGTSDNPRLRIGRLALTRRWAYVR